MSLNTAAVIDWIQIYVFYFVWPYYSLVNWVVLNLHGILQFILSKCCDNKLKSQTKLVFSSFLRLSLKIVFYHRIPYQITGPWGAEWIE